MDDIEPIEKGYNLLDEEEKIQRYIEIMDLFFSCLESELKKEYADNHTLQLLDRAKIIMIDK